MKNIFDLYKKESFTEEDNKLIDEAIENGDIDTDDIIDDWRGWQAENQRLCNEVLEYFMDFDEHYNNGLTHPQNWERFKKFLIAETE